ncbi:hypothetical protein [uncultured Bacteroides sp.]|uniref:hypothetical protein n=1 Tax=uncultured Bacteroides sp. TaxID=162156 RepID=UPI002AA8D364|nr:hypothetical protein [uncultured Bacteroides sp.]
MKKVVVGLVIGTAIGYVIRKLQNDGKFDYVRDGANELINKSKRNLKNAADIAKNEVTYLKDKVEDKIGK